MISLLKLITEALWKDFFNFLISSFFLGLFILMLVHLHEVMLGVWFDSIICEDGPLLYRTDSVNCEYVLWFDSAVEV